MGQQGRGETHQMQVYNCGPIQVVGNAAQQGLLDLLPVAAGRDRPTKSALDNRDQRLNSPALAIDLTGKGQLQLAAIGVRGHASPSLV